MGIVWEDIDVAEHFAEFGVECLYFQARMAPDKRYGLTKLDSDAIHGFRYAEPQSVRLVRSSISQKIILSDQGRAYQGGATFTIPPTALIDGKYKSVPMYDTVFLGDIIIIKTKANRDWDMLKKGSRDQIFAFDVKAIISVTSVNISGDETIHAYGRDYTLAVDGVECTATPRIDGSGIIDIASLAEFSPSSLITVSWKAENPSAENPPVIPADGDTYAVEFMCSPNYVVMPLQNKDRATEENDLPKTVQCVKRAYFNPTRPAMDQVPTQNDIGTQESGVY